MNPHLRARDLEFNAGGLVSSAFAVSSMDCHDSVMFDKGDFTMRGYPGDS